jgi:hypothetical protein
MATRGRSDTPERASTQTISFRFCAATSKRLAGSLTDTMFREEDVQMASLMLAVIIAGAVALVAWRGIALFNYTFHKKDL